MISDEIINWLLDGDVSIQYQVHRDLLGVERPDLQVRIAKEGWGARFLSNRKDNGHWGRGFYRPKWISSHYTLLDLKNLAISPDIAQIRQTIRMLIENEKGPDGGVNPSHHIKNSDVCLNGMFLNYAAYFKTAQESLTSIVDFILAQHMPDGGFNCHNNRKGARHSSLHSTLSVLEGISEYEKNGYRYRLDELKHAEQKSREFIMQHRLFKSDKTGEIIKRAFLYLAYPCRWKYDILRALEYFQSAGVPYDKRMKDAIDIIFKKRRKDGTWPLQAKHPGHVHFDMETAGKSSRWNTLRALRSLNQLVPDFKERGQIYN
jgi:hypothetical protein